MELKQMKELMAAMERTNTKKLSLKKEGQFELVLERHDLPRLPSAEGSFSDEDLFQQEINLRKARILSQRDSSLFGQEEEGQETSPRDKAYNEKKAANEVYVTSPMVGTLYLAPSPEDPYFVKVGDTVEKNTVVCIIEAMKVMNEIKAQVSGTIAEVLVGNGEPVEFGSKLFRLEGN